MTAGQWFARVVTSIVVRVPVLWNVFRRPLTANFDRLAPEWDATRVHEVSLSAMRAALDGVEQPPAKALDLGTGTGAVARLIAARWPEAEVVGADVSNEMVKEARRLATTDTQRYEVADASRLPYGDGEFELVTMNNVIPFFDGEPTGSISILQGQTFTYVYLSHDPGTYMYHCHVEDTEHVHMGMTGLVFVRPGVAGRQPEISPATQMSRKSREKTPRMAAFRSLTEKTVRSGSNRRLICGLVEEANKVYLI